MYNIRPSDAGGLKPGGFTVNKTITERAVLKSSKLVTSAKGTVTIEGPVSGELLAEMVADEGLKNFRPAERQLEALVKIAGMELGNVFIARRGQMLVGYVAFHPAERFERWGETGMKEILELGAIEVARDWRSDGVAKALMDAAFAGDYFEDFIVVATEYYWHWDTESAGLSVWSYRKMMENLLEPYGLETMGTDDPEICSHPANALMVRIGSRVSERAVAEFHKLRYKNR